MIDVYKRQVKGDDEKMITLTGKSVFGGVAIGKIAFYKRNEITIKRIHVDDTEGEVKRFETAKEKAVAQLQELYDKAMEDVGESNAMIFEIHQMMLEDLDYVESIVNIITTQEVNAEYAIGTTADNFAAMFQAMDDAYTVSYTHLADGGEYKQGKRRDYGMEPG